MPLCDGLRAEDVQQAAQALADGRLVAFPTETVYGLGARADRDDAVAAIFAAKGRPVNHPLIVHVAEPDAARAWAAHWPDTAQRLAEALWPGPLTLIVPRRNGWAAGASGGHATVALRCPAHPVALHLLRAAALLGVPGVAAPSANRFGRVSPTTAAHVQAEFGPDLLVLDAGPCDVGIESAIVDCSGPQPMLLRPGSLSRHHLEQALGQALAARGAGAAAAPGTLAAHYAPTARVRLLDTATLQARLRCDAVPHTAAPYTSIGLRRGVAVYSRTSLDGLHPQAASGFTWRAMPPTAQEAARDLFATLRKLDDAGMAEIWVEAPPADMAWDGVRDRLARAAATGD